MPTMWPRPALRWISGERGGGLLGRRFDARDQPGDRRDLARADLLNSAEDGSGALIRH
jgi:hypothetical protein